jgi:ribosomal protein S18 acetylase RimI-like enzyme
VPLAGPALRSRTLRQGLAFSKPSAMQIRPARPEDAPALWSLMEPIVRAGETYALDPGMSEAEAMAYWLAPDKETLVAEEDGAILGTYVMRANQAGGGRHVCNCAFMTSMEATGRGVARRMCEHALDHARTRGYRAMQFNFVVSTNERAVRLWQSLGFEIVGRLPRAFDHPVHGYVDALVMFRSL